jgi:hypothetical protein
VAELTDAQIASVEQAAARVAELIRRYPLSPKTNPGFAVEQVETWLEEANGPRRAPWVHWPDASRLAADLSAIDFTDEFVAHHPVMRQVRRIAGMMRKLADVWDDPALSAAVGHVMRTGSYLAWCNDPDALKRVVAEEVAKTSFAGCADVAAARDRFKQRLERQVADMIADAHAFRALFNADVPRALFEDRKARKDREDRERERFSRVLRQTADETEPLLAEEPHPTHADELRCIYAWVARTLEKHTGSRVSIRPTSPDARFARDVLEHAGVPWRSRLWRSTIEAGLPWDI